MNAPDRSAGQWQIHLPPDGEILAATAEDSAIRLGLLGIPEGYTAAEIEGWLADLIGVARETGREDTVPRPIPALLHHGLTGLLFSHAQLWNREGQRAPLSFALVRVQGRIGFGWIGDADVRVTSGGAPVACDTVIVRDDDGREARALALPDANALQVDLAWAAALRTDGKATLTAQWQPAEVTQADVRPAALAPETKDASAPAAAAVDDDVTFLDSEGTPFDFGSEGPPAPMPGLVREPSALASSAPEAAPDAKPAPKEAGRPDWMTPSTVTGWEDAAPRGADASDGDDTPELPAPWEEEDAGEESEPPRAALPAPEPEPEPEPAPAPTPAPAPSRPAARPMPAPVIAHMRATAPPEPAAAPRASLDEAEPAARAPQSALQPGEQMVFDVPEPALAIDDTELDADDELAAPAQRGSRIRRLFSRLAFWKGREADVATDAFADDPAALAHDVAGVPDQVPPSPEAGEITERAIADYTPVEAEEDRYAADDREAIGVEPTDETAEPQPVASLEQMAPPPAAPAETPADSEALADEPPAPRRVSAPPASAAAARARVPMRPEWPSESEMREPVPVWRKPWAWALVMAALFAGGWLVGHFNDERRAVAGRGMKDALRAIGLGGAHFDVMVNSRPQGAWISIDGEDIARRTPASVELEPGEHEITLSFSDLGGATFTVRGVDGESIAMDPPLWGALNVYSSDAEVPVAVTVDGVMRGFAPLRVDSLAPGAHDVRFSGPGLPSWGQTVQIRVGEGAELIARPMTSPAMGVIEVRASLATETGNVDVDGARVFLDGEPAGATPLTLELPRGPHSIRIEHQGESSQVQLIDLPGGNQRFASFQLQPGHVHPALVPIDPPAEVPLDRPTVVSVALEGVQSTDVREMWLHVQTPDGPWRRYEMAWLKAPGSVVAVAVFPTTMFDADGRVAWYASASTRAGDEYFSELQRTARPGAAPAARRARR